MSKLFALVGLDRFAENEFKTVYHVLLTDKDKEVLKDEKDDNSHLFKSMKIFAVKNDLDLQEKLSILNQKEKEKAFKKNTKDFMQELSEVPEGVPTVQAEKTDKGISYNFYLFSRLTHDLLCKASNYSIPYDVEMEIIKNAFDRFKYDASVNVSYNDQIKKFIQNDKTLANEIARDNEGGVLTHVCPVCQSQFNLSDFPYQVNDNTELTYCSYECSASATLKVINKFLVNKGTVNAQEVTSIVHNT